MSTKLFRQLSRRKFYRILAAVSILGLLLRLEASRELSGTYPPVTNPSTYTDMYTYQEFARSIVNGGFDFSEGFYYQPFYYTVFLPTIYRVAGTGHWPVIFAQALLGAVTIWLTGITFARLFGKSTGLIGALFLALNRYHIFYTSFTLIAILQSFWISLMLYLILAAGRSNKLTYWLATGVVNGLAVVTRGNALLFVPLVLVFIFKSMRGSVRRAIFAALLFGFGAITPQLPYAVVNYKAHGKLFGASSAASAVLSLGNTPESPPGGREPDAGAGSMEYSSSYHEWMRLDALNGDNHVSISRQITQWIRDEPLAWVELKFRMFLLFWNKMEVPNNVALSTAGNNSQNGLIRSPILIDFFVVGSLGIAGMLFSLMRRNDKSSNRFAISLVLVYCVSTILFYILARFRLPIIPLLCGYSAYGVNGFVKQIRGGMSTYEGYRRKILASVVLVFSFLFVGWGYEVYRYKWEPIVIRSIRPSGVRVPLENRKVIKDHGPQPFGGWVPVSVADARRVTKDFVLKSPNESLARNTVFRFPVFARAGGTVNYSLEYNEGEGSLGIEEVVLQPGLQWIETSVLQMKTEEIVTVALRFEISEYSDVYLLFDTQRNYGRTRIEDNPEFDFGEFVSELVIYK